MSAINEELARNVTMKASVPVIFRGFVKKWTLCEWGVDKWSAEFGNREIPFRCLQRGFVSDEPCWERRCRVKSMTFKKFVDNLENAEDWMYFDYKYLHQWFGLDSELYNEISWKEFGHPDRKAPESTLWVGSSGAHTPLHQDTYGYNIVAQIHGRKRWILFPPESGGLKPTRVPYEESSVYSEINFYCPSNLDVFNGLTGGRVVELCAGDALLVPQGWWHYVQNLDPLNITINAWLPHQRDASTQVSEALIKIFVAQICKDLPEETAKLLVNPNEDDIPDTPLAVLFLQLEKVAKSYLDNRRKVRRAKRQRTREETAADPPALDFDLKALVEDPANNLEFAANITSDELKAFVKENLSVTCKVDEDEVEGATASLCLTKAVIDAYSQSNVIELVKENLFTRLS